MRQIYTVDAKQVVLSEAHPEGVYSNVFGYPKAFDNRNKVTGISNGATTLKLISAEVE